MLDDDLGLISQHFVVKLIGIVSTFIFTWRVEYLLQKLEVRVEIYYH